MSVLLNVDLFAIGVFLLGVLAEQDVVVIIIVFVVVSVIVIIFVVVSIVKNLPSLFAS